MRHSEREARSQVRIETAIALFVVPVREVNRCHRRVEPQKDTARGDRAVQRYILGALPYIADLGAHAHVRFEEPVCAQATQIDESRERSLLTAQLVLRKPGEAQE